ncbi:MAG TPA: hypothetical protein VNA25_21850 [Phycisphaerae bacterium]|nr:hypothetical protein [Phycisphaerae bacterium]
MWKGTWHGKDDMGQDVSNAPRYRVSPQAHDLGQDFKVLFVSVERSQVISNMTVSPNPFWPAFTESGRQISERKAIIRFVLSRKSHVLVGIFPKSVNPKAASWDRTVRLFDLSELEPGEIVVPWDGNLSDKKTPVKEEGEYVVGVRAADIADSKNVVIEQCILVLKRIPFIEDLACVPATFSPDGDGINDTTQIEFRVDAPGVPEGDEVTVAASIFDEKGKKVAALSRAQVPAGQVNRLQWDGTSSEEAVHLLTTESEAGKASVAKSDLPNGTYLVRLLAMDKRKAEAIPAVTQVELKAPVALHIELLLADAETVKELRAMPAELLDENFWKTPDMALRVAPDSKLTDILEKLTWKPIGESGKGRAWLPLPLIVPLQEYVPWVRFAVNKQASATIQVYSLEGGIIASNVLGTASEGVEKKIELGEPLRQALRNDTSYRGVLLVTDIESPVTVKEEFYFHVYKASPPEVGSADEWLILSNTHTDAMLDAKEVARGVKFNVKVNQDSKVRVRIYESPEQRESDREWLWQSPEYEVKKDQATSVEWNGETGAAPGLCPQGQYCYKVTAERVDAQAENLQKTVMPNLRLRSESYGDRLWVVSLPRVTGIPQSGLFCPDGVSNNRSLRLGWKSEIPNIPVMRDLGFDAKVSLSGTIKDADRKRIVLRLLPDSDKPTDRGEWVWDGHDDGGQMVPDGKYRIEWQATYSRTRKDPSAEDKYETLVFTLPIPPTDVEVDRQPVVVFRAPSEPYKVSPDGDGKHDTLNVEFWLGDDAELTAVIECGRSTRHLAKGEKWRAGENVARWDGKDDSSHYFDSGIAHLTINTRDAKGNTRAEALEFSVVSHYQNMAGPARTVCAKLKGLGENARMVEYQRKASR